VIEAAVTATEYFLPERTLTNSDLTAEFPDWSVEKIAEKTGIDCRHVSADGECSSDLAAAAAERLFAGGVDRGLIDFVLFCTQSPDYFLPTSACVLQERLRIPTSAGALDFNLGCSGFVYGLGLAKGLVETGQASRVLLLTGETYTKMLAPGDRSVRTIFGDGGSATLVEAVEAVAGGAPRLGPFVYGTDGSGARNLIVEAGAFRMPLAAAGKPGAGGEEAGAAAPARPTLVMDGGEIFAFTLTTVPGAVEALLEKAGITADDVDLYAFHQANRHMLEHLRRKSRIPAEKFLVHLSSCGNTVSATIPVTLREAQRAGRLAPGAVVALVGFGVGYSWGAALCRWGAR
jgi:3-oxoacyl-[acyl-carrier-protein] synthase III